MAWRAGDPTELQQHASGELVVMCQVDGNWSRARPTFAPVKIKSGLAHEYIGCDAVRIKHLNRNVAVIPTLVESVLLIDFHISSGIVFGLSLKRLRPEYELDIWIRGIMRQHSNFLGKIMDAVDQDGEMTFFQERVTSIAFLESGSKRNPSHSGLDVLNTQTLLNSHRLLQLSWIVFLSVGIELFKELLAHPLQGGTRRAQLVEGFGKVWANDRERVNRIAREGQNTHASVFLCICWLLCCRRLMPEAAYLLEEARLSEIFPHVDHVVPLCASAHNEQSRMIVLCDSGVCVHVRLWACTSMF